LAVPGVASPCRCGQTRATVLSVRMTPEVPGYAGEVPPLAPERIVIRNHKRLATGNDLDAMRVQITPARAPGELATEVVGGRFDGADVATAAGHLGKPAIHRLRTPARTGEGQSPG